jgi:hypothetical protein
MSSEVQPDKLALLVAEEILRTIFGDDLQGCPVTLEQIASILHNAMEQRSGQDKNLLDTFGQIVEAIHLLSTPPDARKVPNQDELRLLLTERLDAIHTITTKTIKTTTLLKAQQRLRDSRE